MEATETPTPNAELPTKATKTPRKKTTKAPEPAAVAVVDDHSKRVSFASDPATNPSISTNTISGNESTRGPIEYINKYGPSVVFGGPDAKATAAPKAPTLAIPTADQMEQAKLGKSAGPTVLDVPPPSLAELRGETVQQLAQENVRRSQARIKQSMTAAQARTAEKEAREAMKGMKPENNDRKAILCNQLNAYRDRFGTKIKFAWKKNYEPDSMDEATLQATVTQVQMLLNSVSVPELMKNSLGKLMEAVEVLSMTQTWLPWMRLAGLKEQYDLQADNGVFDSELSELVIKYAHVFQKPPEIRLAAKLGGLATEVGWENYKGISANNIVSRGGTKLAQRLQANTDL